MARINLLPWREELRKEKQKEFLVILGAAVLASATIMTGVHYYFERQMEFQNARNAFLNQEIEKLDKQIKEIETLDATKRRLQARLDIIQQLQASRPEVVHLFDELVRTLPDGVQLTKVQQDKAKIVLNGQAQSNGRISSYMWNIEKSTWLAQPTLDIIQTQNRHSMFVMRASQAREQEGGQ